MQWLRKPYLHGLHSRLKGYGTFLCLHEWEIHEHGFHQMTFPPDAGGEEGGLEELLLTQCGGDSHIVLFYLRILYLSMWIWEGGKGEKKGHKEGSLVFSRK